MSQTLPFQIKGNSPDQLVFLLDSLISSPLCPHTKEWICYRYLLDNHSMVFRELNILIVGFLKGRPHVKYGHSLKAAPLDPVELASHIKNLEKPSGRIMSLEQAQLWKLTAKEFVCRHAYSDLYAYRHLPEMSLWLALQGRFSVGDLLNGRSFTFFIEMHWRRLLSQSTTSLKNDWQHHRYPANRERCRCPGRELAPLLKSQPLDSLSGDIAEVVMKDIMSYVDSRILLLLAPDLRKIEDSRCQAIDLVSEDWYTPKSHGGLGRWKGVSEFKALAAVADRLVRAFERIRDEPRIMSMAQAQLDHDCESLANQINSQ